jgi:hypothetical protein
MSANASPAPPITHYENFPVASWLCPARLRAPIGAIYHFARTADDLADEGEANCSPHCEFSFFSCFFCWFIEYLLVWSRIDASQVITWFIQP